MSEDMLKKSRENASYKKEGKELAAAIVKHHYFE